MMNNQFSVTRALTSRLNSSEGKRIQYCAATPRCGFPEQASHSPLGCLHVVMAVLSDFDQPFFYSLAGCEDPAHTGTAQMLAVTLLVGFLQKWCNQMPAD